MEEPLPHFDMNFDTSPTRPFAEPHRVRLQQFTPAYQQKHGGQPVQIGKEGIRCRRAGIRVREVCAGRGVELRRDGEGIQQTAR